jgi:iron complex outermembrane receptor protein
MKHYKLSLVLTTSLVWCGPVYAQATDAGSQVGAVDQPSAVDQASAVDQSNATGRDEIIVTAQKRSERLTDVPLSISAASGVQLARQSITSAVDLPKVAPGLTFVTSGYGSLVYSIRGMGFYDNSLAVTPAVTIYLDQVPLPYAAMTSGVALDPERVEVLKGPQGTLFGNNSTGGAINFIAAKPTDDFKAAVDLTYGRFSQVEAGGFISGPITDNLRARFAFRSEHRGDYITAQRLTNLTNTTTGDGVRDLRSGRTLNDRSGQRDFTNGRVILDYTPTDRMKFELTASAWRDRSDSQPAQFLAFAPAQPNNGLPGAFIQQDRPRAPNNSRVADWDQTFDLAQDTKFWQLALRADVELNDQLTLTSLTSYARYDTYLPTDNDGSDWNDINNKTFGKITSFSQELRLAADLGDRVKVMAGANFARDKSTDDQHVRMDATNAFSADETFSGHTSAPGIPNRVPRASSAGSISTTSTTSRSKPIRHLAV